MNTIPPMKEKEWQAQVVELAQRFGYDFIYHTWNSRHSPAGFPDLIILKDGRMVVAELKREGENLSAEQYFWLLEFAHIPHAVVYVWWPRDWDEVTELLRRYR